MYETWTFLFLETTMRYHSEAPSFYFPIYGEIYLCDHPIYNQCTLFKMGDKGLSVIQQRFDEKTKDTRWEDIDAWIANGIYLNKNFLDYFQEHSGECANGLYPTVTVRQIMWALRMKPLKKERWETVFDRASI